MKARTVLISLQTYRILKDVERKLKEKGSITEKEYAHHDRRDFQGYPVLPGKGHQLHVPVGEGDQDRAEPQADLHCEDLEDPDQRTVDLRAPVELG